MKRSILCRAKVLLGFVCLYGQLLQAQVKHATATLYPSYKGLVMAGYQGWFRAEGDGTGQGFNHYFRNVDHCGIDMWPDMTEYKKQYATPFKTTDGKQATLFSSYDESTVALHFSWMKQYGVDGVFMQRFFTTAKEKKNSNNSSLAVLRHAFQQASVNKRAIAIMYDLSGLRASGEDCSQLIADWKYLVDSLKITDQAGAKTYLHHNGKPVVAIWGVGFPDRPYNIRNIGLERFMDFLQHDPEYGQCAVMLGVPTFWRDLNADCVNDPYLHTLIKKADILLPW